MIKDELQTIAWRDFITFAWAVPEMRQAFEAQTKLRLHLKPTSSIDALIDIATGVQRSIDAAYREAFVQWVTINHWGLDEAPVAYREHLLKAKDPSRRK